MKKSNPRLKRAFLEVVENQLEANDPPETRETLKRLTSEGISADNARIYIAQAVCVEVYHALKHKQEFNLPRYLKNLKRLPEKPGE